MYYNILSLKNIGKSYEDASLIKNFSSLNELLEFSNDDKYNDAYDNLVKSLNGLNIDEASKKLKDLKINPDLSIDLLNAAKNADLLTGSADEIADGIKKVGSSTDGVDKTRLAVKGLGHKIEEIAPKVGIAVGAIAVLTAGLVVFNKTQHKFTEAQEKATTSASNYQEEASKLQSLNSELDNTKARIQELQSLQKAGTITFAQETELAKLQETNSELERQVELQNDLVQTKLKMSAYDAKKASETSKSYTEDMQEALGEVGGFFAGLFGNTTITDAKGNPVNAKDVWEDAETNNGDSTIEGKIKKDIEDINNLKTKLEHAYDDGNIKEIEKLQDEINTSKSKLYENAEIVQGWLDQSVDENGVAAEGFEKAVDGYRAILNDVENIDASEAEISLNNLETFFSSTSGKTIKKYLDDIIESGGTAEDALAAFEATGLDLADLNIDSESFIRYFQDVEKAAKQTKETLKTVDGSVDGVKAAFESENKDSDWNSMADYLEKANELYKQGKIGTDDFKSAAQFMSPKLIKPDSGDFKYDADAYVKAWEKSQSKIKRYFDKDNPLQSVTNFTNDLTSKGLATESGDELTWKFKNSAEAANELGLSVQATEAIMHSLESYGAEFDKVMFSSEGIEKYKKSLDGVKELYNSMSDDDPGKERLGKLIENWDSEYAGYQEDLSTLTEDQIVKIKFEYDLATVEQKVEDAIELAKGTNKTEDWAASQMESENRKEMLEKESGYDADSSGDMNYANADKIYDDLNAKRAATDDENEIKQINKQMTALNQLKSEFQKYRLDGGELDWASYLNTDQADEVFDNLKDDLNLSRDAILDLLDIELQPKIKLDADTTKAQEKINGIISEDHRTITMDVDASTDDINYALENIVPGQTLKFNTEINGEPVGVEAIKNIDGTVSYYIDGQEVPEDAIAGVEYNKTRQEDPENKNAGLNYYKDYQDPASNDNANVNYDLGSQDPPLNKVAQVIYKVGGTIGKGVSGALSKAKESFNEKKKKKNGTASVDGTARTVRHGSAFATGNWGAKKTEKALTGELGTETIIRNGRFFTVGDNGAEFVNVRKGDVIFNHKQTEELFKNGHVTSGGGRGKVVGNAFATGTAYANGWRRPSGSSSSKKKKSSSSKSSKSKSSSSSKSSSKSKSDAEKSAEDLMDWIAILLERVARQTEIAVDAIDNAIGLVNKQTATAKAISKVQNEISTNQQAYNKYMAKANSVGLSSSYASQVRNGTLKIENIKDENLKTKIDDYQKWYENALKCEDEIRKLKEQEQELAKRRLENIEDWYDAIVDINKAMIDVTDTKQELNEALGTAINLDINVNAVKNSIKAQTDTYNKLVQKLSDYQKEFNTQVSNGTIKKNSDAWLEGQKKINEFTADVNEAAKELIEFKDKLQQIEYDTIQNLIDGFDRAVSKLEAKIELMESRDETVPENLYTEQMDNNNARIEEIKKLRDKKLKEQKYYDVNSERYQELAEEINNLDEETYELLTDNEKLKDSIFELRFTPIDEALEKYDDLSSEIKSFYDLLNEDAFFDKNGGGTADLVAGLALLQQNIAVSKQKISDLTTGLNKLEESWKNNVISEKEYLEKSEEYRDQLQESVADVKDFQDAITDLYMTQMKKEVEATEELIDKYSEARKRKESYFEYDRKLKKQQKSVDLLKAQIAALESVNILPNVF